MARVSVATTHCPSPSGFVAGKGWQEAGRAPTMGNRVVAHHAAALPGAMCLKFSSTMLAPSESMLHYPTTKYMVAITALPKQFSRLTQFPFHGLCCAGFASRQIPLASARASASPGTSDCWCRANDTGSTPTIIALQKYQGWDSPPNNMQRQTCPCDKPGQPMPLHTPPMAADGVIRVQ